MRFPFALSIYALVAAAAGCGARGDSSTSIKDKTKAHYLANEGVLLVSRKATSALRPR